MRPGNIILFALITLLLASTAALAAQGDVQQLAVIPLQNMARLDEPEADYLSDVIRGAATKVDPDGIALVPQAKVVKAVRRRAGSCDETCAIKVAFKTGADLVLLPELRRISGELRATVKLLTKEGELVGMQRAHGADPAVLDRTLEDAVQELLAGSAGQGASSAPTSAPSARPQPSVPLDEAYYAHVRVNAMGTKEGDPESEPRSVEAEVFINNQLVGRTPFEDGLPTGTYEVEVRSRGQVLHSQTIAMTAGSSYVVEARAIIPLTAAQRAEIEKKRNEQYVAQQRELRLAWEKTHGSWQAEDQRIGKKRRPFLIGGTVLFLGGLGLVISGSVLVGLAVNEDEQLDDLSSQYQLTADPETIVRLSKEVDEAERTRDIYNGWGATFLVVGGVSLITSVVLYAVLPSRPEEPTPPQDLKLAEFQVQPLVAPNFAGLGFSAKF